MKEPRAVDFEKYLKRWNLTPDGAPFETNVCNLMPVRYRGQPAMLKLAFEEEERLGGLLMQWWDGDGAARVLQFKDEALLLERVMGTRSLATMARHGQDDEATRILCEVAAKLHAPRPRPLPELVPLTRWFEELERQAPIHSGLLNQSLASMRELFVSPQDLVPLHGDIHHANILDGGARGWLAIDPKRLWGERAFDFVNILRNPDETVANLPGRFARQANVIVAAAGLDRTRFLKWVVAFTGLSAAWYFADGGEPKPDLRITALALGELQKGS